MGCAFPRLPRLHASSTSSVDLCLPHSQGRDVQFDATDWDDLPGMIVLTCHINVPYLSSIRGTKISGVQTFSSLIDDANTWRCPVSTCSPRSQSSEDPVPRHSKQQATAYESLSKKMSSSLVDEMFL